MLEIKGIKGVDISEVLERKHNIWIGISLSNKFFNRENIKLLIEFALKYTKEKVLIWIPGRMHATNYYIDRISRADALERAFKDEDKCREVVADIMREMPLEISQKIEVSNYDDTCTPKHIKQREILLREFSKKGEFYNKVIEVTSEIIQSRGRTYSKERAENLAIYVISELPLFIDGAQTNSEDIIYTIIPYPGFGKIDELEMDLIEGKKYPELTKQLGLSQKVGIVDVQPKT